MSMIRSCIKYSLERGSANDVPLLPTIDPIFSFLMPQNYTCSILTHKMMTETKGCEKRRQERAKEMEYLTVFIKWNGSLELDRCDVERYSCQVIIISYKALRSHLAELTLFNLSSKWKSLHPAAEVTIPALSLRQAAYVIVISTKEVGRTHLNKVFKRSRGR